MIRVLNSSGNNPVDRIFPPINTYTEIQEPPPMVLRRPRAIKAAPEQPKEPAQRKEEKIEKTIEAQETPAKTSPLECMQIRRWIEEMGFEAEFKERYLKLRKIYSQYQENNSEIEKWKKEKKAYSRYTREGKYQKWYINKNHIRPLQKKQEILYDTYMAIRDEFPNNARLYYRVVPLPRPSPPLPYN